jgi:hypothetical protein
VFVFVFGDGTMSVTDFDLELDRLAHANGDSARRVMSCKFLRYKYYGAAQGRAIIRQTAVILHRLWAQMGLSARDL